MQEEEIDLKQVLHRLRKNPLYNNFEGVVLFIFKYNIWFILFILLGATAGYFYRDSLSPDYKAKIIASSDILDPKVVKEIMPQLNSSIDRQNIGIVYSDKNNVLLVEKDPFIININSNEFYNFKKMNAEEVFIFDVIMKDTVSFHTVSKDIVSFFESEPHYTSIKTKNQQSLIEKQGILNNEIDYIDSLLKDKSTNDYSGLIAEKTLALNYLVDINKQIENNNIININSQSSPETVPHPLHNYIMILFAAAFFIIGGILLWIIKH